MRILITGGAGFIGSHIADAMIEAGHKIAVVDNLATGNRENLSSVAELHIGDITDSRWLTEVAQAFQPDAICHQAAQVSVVASVNDPTDDARQNILGMISVLEVVRRLPNMPKIIFASSGGAVYGKPQSIPVPETAAVAPYSPYGLSKSVGEQYLRLYGALYGVRYTILRYANVFGPRQSTTGEAGVCAIFTHRVLNGGAVQIFGDGTQTRDYVFVTDVAKANLMALSRGDGLAINIGTGVETSTQTIFDLICQSANRTVESTYAPMRPGEIQSISLDVSFAETSLGWCPKVEFAEGIALTVDYYRSLDTETKLAQKRA